MVGVRVFWGYFCVVLSRVTGVSCDLGPDWIGILCFALAGVAFGPDRIGILCSALTGVVFGADCIGILCEITARNHIHIALWGQVVSFLR